MSRSTSSEGECIAVINAVESMSGRRLAAIEDAGAVHPEVSLENFFEYLLPLRKCLKQHDAVQMVVEKLKKGEDALLKHDYLSDAFVWHEILSKQKGNATEEATYTTLEDIARRIEEIVKESAGEELEAVVQYKDASRKAPKSLNRTSEHIPDGYFILRNKQESGSADHWVDIAVVGEFRQGQGRNATNKNARQIIWDMHRILQEDDSRRFAFGFTIEANSMRFWYVNRADIFISQDFDFVASPEHLVRFFLAVTYSYEHQLGWDPTMEYVKATKHEPRHLLISVHSADHEKKMVFKTLEALSNNGTRAIRGRGTRVWRVESVIKNGQPVKNPQSFVLKDSWIDSDREREGAIIAMVRKDATKLPEDGKKALLSALLTVKMYGDVWIDQDDTSGIEKGFYDSTFTEEQREQIFPTGSSFIRLQRPATADATEEHTTDTRSRAKGNPHSAFQNYDLTTNPVTYDPKTHFRIVFCEVCTPIHDERSLPKVLSALGAATTALQGLHLAGWVHRDISSGNVMLWHDQVKISDFEFAERFTKMLSKEQIGERRHGNCTGTPNYTALEVVLEEFLFMSNEQSSPEASSNTNVTKEQDIEFFMPSRFSPRYAIDVSEPEAQFSKEEEEGPQDSEVWQYHPLHDVESLFWLCDQLTLNRDLYFARVEYPETDVYVPEGGETINERPERVKRQAEAALVLRPNHPHRSQCLTTEGFLKKRLANTHPLLRWKPRKSTSKSRSVVEALEEMRCCIVSSYRSASVDPSTITNSIAMDIYPIISKALDQASRCLRSSPAMINYVPCIRPLAREAYKVWKQDDVKDIVDWTPTKTVKKAKDKAKATSSQIPQPGSVVAKPRTKRKAKAKSTPTLQPSAAATHSRTARKRKRDAKTTDTEASSKSSDIEAAQPEVAQLSAQVTKKRKKTKATT